MAATGAMADFGRMPTSRKVLVFAAIGLVLGLLYYQFVFKKLKTRVAEAEATQVQLSKQNRQFAADIPKFAVLRQDMAELQKAIEENQKALPTEAEVPHFFETLERKMTESGVEITKWKKGAEEAVESFVKVPVDIELVGTFMQLKRFFASLVQKPTAPAIDEEGVEERERIVSIENLVLAAPVVRNREIVLTARFTAVTFRQEDKASKAGPTPKATPAGRMPGAGTPAGAKARVEDAMKREDTKVKEAVDQADGLEAGDRLKGGQ